MLEPYYDSYVACIGWRRGGPPAGDAARRRTSPSTSTRCGPPSPARTRMILLNTPHNPTGAVLHATELQAIADVAVEHDLVVVSRRGLRAPGLRRRPAARADRHAAGDARAHAHHRLGGQDVRVHRLEGRLGHRARRAGRPRPAGIKQFLTYVSGGPFQHAIAAGLALPDSYFAGLRDGLAAKRDRLCAGLGSVGLEVYRPRGTYFVLTDVRPLGYDDGMAFCLDLPGGPAWWPSRPGCSTTTRPSAGRWCGGPSASATRSSTTPSPGWPEPSPDAPKVREDPLMTHSEEDLRRRRALAARPLPAARRAPVARRGPAPARGPSGRSAAGPVRRAWRARDAGVRGRRPVGQAGRRVHAERDHGPAVRVSRLGRPHRPPRGRRARAVPSRADEERALEVVHGIRMEHLSADPRPLSADDLAGARIPWGDGDRASPARGRLPASAVG